MEGTSEKECSPLWNLYQQILSDMKNSTPLWEDFISKATKLHSALKSALAAIASFLDSFQKIADAATSARGATKDIGTALTRVCLRHRAIEGKMKTLVSTLMDSLISPLTERTEEWKRGGSASAGRELARECRRARAELRRRAHDAQRRERRARRAHSSDAAEARRRADVSVQDVQERKQQLEEMEEKVAKAALVEERSRFCHFVALLNPVVECEVAMLAEVGHLQEGNEQLIRQISEPRTLPPSSLQVICDVKSSHSAWVECASAPHSPTPGSRLGSRHSSLTSISSFNTQCSDHHIANSTASCSTPVSNASSTGTLSAPNDHRVLSQRVFGSGDSGFRSQDAPLRLSLYLDNGSDNQSVSSECATPSRAAADDANASCTWPELKDTAQFERAASAIMGRPHTISAACERGHGRPALSVHTFADERSQLDGIYTRPPLPNRCAPPERPTVPNKLDSNWSHQEFKPAKPSSLPPHLTKDIPQAVYVNMSELATLAASRAHGRTPAIDPPHQEKVCSESSASESSLESSSGYGSQGAFAAEDHNNHHQHHHPVMQPPEDVEIVTLRRDTDAIISAARDSLSISLGSLEEAVRCLDEACETPAYATVSKKPAVPKRRPLSMTAGAWSRRGSASSQGKPPPPVRRSSSISRPQRTYSQNNQSAMCSTDVDNLPPPPAFLLQPDTAEINDAHQPINVAETVKQLTELRHTPASPGLVRRSIQQFQNTDEPLTTFQLARSNFSSSTSLNSSNQYGQLNQLAYRKNSVNTSNADSDRRGSVNTSSAEPFESPQNSTPSTPSYGENSFSSFGPRAMVNESAYGQTGYKLQQEKKYGGGVYAQPALVGGYALTRMDPVSPLALRKNIAARSHSADRHGHTEHGGLIATLSAKLAPQLSPRSPRRHTPGDHHKGKGVTSVAPPAFLDKLSLAIQRHQQVSDGHVTALRDRIAARVLPDPRVCHTSLMEQIKRGAKLRRNKQCDDRSAPKIR